MRPQQRSCGLSVRAERPLPRQMPPKLGMQNSLRHKPCPDSSSPFRCCMLSDAEDTAEPESQEHKLHRACVRVKLLCLSRRSCRCTQTLHKQARSLEQRCIDAEALASQLQQQLPPAPVHGKTLGVAGEAAPADQQAGAGLSTREEIGFGVQLAGAGARCCC